MRTLLILVILLLALLAACGQLKDEARATAASVVDCTKTEAAAAIATYAPTLEAVLLDSAGLDGRLDLARVKAATKGYATNAARCVIASTLARLLKPAPATPGAPQSSPLELHAGDLEALRTELLGGMHYKLADAQL